MSSWSESALRRRALAFYHLQPGSTREFLFFLTFPVVIKNFCAGSAIRAASTRDVPEGCGFLSRTADSYAS